MDEEYTGYKEVNISPEDVTYFYNHLHENLYDLNRNQYVILHDEITGNIIETYKWDGVVNVKVPFKQINSRYIGKVKPRNPHQQIAIDMLYDQNTTVKIITGKFGVGKDYLMSAVATDLLDIRSLPTSSS